MNQPDHTEGLPIPPITTDNNIIWISGDGNWTTAGTLAPIAEGTAYFHNNSFHYFKGIPVLFETGWKSSFTFTCEFDVEPFQPAMPPCEPTLYDVDPNIV